MSDSHFDAIVVGSGFGGSVTAYRLAEAGKRVLRARARPGVPARLVHAQPVQGARQLLGPGPRADRHVPLLVVQGDRRAGVGGPRRRLADLRQRLPAQGRALVRRRGRQRRRVRELAGHARRPRPALRPRREDDRAAALPVRARAVRGHAEDDRVQAGRRAHRHGVVPARSWRSRSPTRAARRSPARRSSRRSRTCTGATASPASCAGSATSAATSAPRTRSTTTTSRTPSTTAPRSARWPTCARSSRARAAATGSATRRSTTPAAMRRRTGARPR